MHLRTLSPLCPRRPHHRTRTRNSTTPPGPESDHPNLTCRPRKPLCRRCSRRVSEQRIAANWAPGPPRKRSAQSLRADAGIMCVSRRAHLACRRARAIAISRWSLGRCGGAHHRPFIAIASLSMCAGRQVAKKPPDRFTRTDCSSANLQSGPAENGVWESGHPTAATLPNCPDTLVQIGKTTVLTFRDFPQVCYQQTFSVVWQQISGKSITRCF